MVAAVAVALFALVFAARLIDDDSSAPLGLLYGLPISIVALYFGPRLGAAASFLSVGLVAVATAFDLSPPGAVAIALVFVPYAWLLGLVGDRMRAVVTATKDAEGNLSELIETVRESFVAIDEHARIIALNDEAEELFGFPSDEAIGVDFAQLLAPEPAAELRENLSLAVAGKPAPWFRRWHDEVEGTHRSGEPRTFELLVAPLRDGETWRFNIFVFDVSERARTWQEHTRMAAIVESSVDAIYSYAMDGSITSWNRGAERLYGYSAEEMTGNTTRELIPPDRPSDVDRILSHVKGGELVEDYETVRVAKGGRYLDVALTVSPVRDPAGEVIEAAIVARDISERKRQERYRQGQHEATRLLAEVPEPAAAVPKLTEIMCRAVRWPCGAIWYRDGDDQRLRCVETWHNPEIDSPPCPFEPGQVVVLDSPPAKTLTWENIGAGLGVTPAAALAAEAGVQTVIWVPVTIDGTMLGAVQLLTRRRLERDEPAISMTSAVSSLLTALMRRRYAEVEADRLKDEFFGMVSHEMRTPLTSIIGYAELLADFESERLSEQGRGFLEVIERNARREMRLVADLLALVRIEAGTFSVEAEEIDLTAVAREAVDAAMPRAEKGGVSLEATLDQVPESSADPHRIGQVIDNLLSNAIKFTPDGGKVELRLTYDDERARIEVADTGIGIPADEQAKLFDRLYRASSATERHIQGLGLGLTIVKAIVEAHDGTISVSSVPEKGTTFLIDLPLDKIPSVA